MLNSQYTALTKWEESLPESHIRRTEYSNGHVSSVRKFTKRYRYIAVEYTLTPRQFDTFKATFDMTIYSDFQGISEIIQARPTSGYSAKSIPGSVCGSVLGYTVSFTIETLAANPIPVASTVADTLQFTVIKPATAASAMNTSILTNTRTGAVLTVATGDAIPLGRYTTSQPKIKVNETGAIVDIDYRGPFTGKTVVLKDYVVPPGEVFHGLVVSLYGSVACHQIKAPCARTYSMHLVGSMLDLPDTITRPYPRANSTATGWVNSPVLGSYISFNLPGRYNTHEMEQQLMALIRADQGAATGKTFTFISQSLAPTSTLIADLTATFNAGPNTVVVQGMT